jgi:hypothetical protein
LSSPASGWSFAGSYADVENISAAVGAAGNGGGVEDGGRGRPEADWLPDFGWTLEEKVVELNKSAEVV